MHQIIQALGHLPGPLLDLLKYGNALLLVENIKFRCSPSDAVSQVTSRKIITSRLASHTLPSVNTMVIEVADVYEDL